MKMITSTLEVMREFIFIRASSGYTTEAEKLERKDSKINLHLLKAAATKKLGVRVWVHSIGEYLYILSRTGLTLRYWTYTISQEDRFIRMKNRGKQSVKKGIWYFGGKKEKKKKKKQRGKGFPIDLLASAAAPFLGEIAKPIFKTIFSRGRRKRWWEKKYY